jgi:cytidylate kinase
VNARVIAIDGPAGSGKSSTARAVARTLGFAHLDSGALYRAVTLGALDANVPEAAGALVGLAKSLPVRLSLVGDVFRPEVAGVEVSRAIREGRVTARVSQVAAMPQVRDWVNGELRAAAALHPRGVVVDGRDIGTVVFPHAQLKIFLTATAEERAKRRVLQTGSQADAHGLQQAQSDLDRRDQADSGRAVAPLRSAADAIVLDTTTMGFDEQVDHIVELSRKVLEIGS